MPPDAHVLASGRLKVFCTRCKDRQLVSFERWESKEELVKTLQASCSFARHGVLLADGEAYWDGGMAKDANLIEQEDGNTVTVSPFSGQGACISPDACREWKLTTRFGDVSWRNIVRGWDVSIPRSSSKMNSYVAQGQIDCLRWLQRSE